MYRLFMTFSAFASLLLSLGASAAEPLRVTLEAIEHQRAQLVIVEIDGSTQSYTPAELEALPTYRIVTATPWRDLPAAFDGILLSDLLAAHGLEEVQAIRVTAENDFATTIPREVWMTTPVLLATRVDGRAHSRRERGPIQFVVPAEDYAVSQVLDESHLVWMAARIEPAK